VCESLRNHCPTQASLELTAPRAGSPPAPVFGAHKDHPEHPAFTSNVQAEALHQVTERRYTGTDVASLQAVNRKGHMAQGY